MVLAVTYIFINMLTLDIIEYNKIITGKKIKCQFLLTSVWNASLFPHLQKSLSSLAENIQNGQE